MRYDSGNFKGHFRNIIEMVSQQATFRAKSTSLDILGKIPAYQIRTLFSGAIYMESPVWTLKAS